jgi:hypothetical protein
VMGGHNIKVDSGYAGCYSANDSQLMIHEGAADKELPTNVIFSGIVADRPANSTRRTSRCTPTVRARLTACRTGSRKAPVTPT